MNTFIKPFSSPALNKAFLVCLILYVAFALFLVWRSSAVGIDGRRYFSLFDDAMISMRYAFNLVQGGGLVWNPGERVEGFTNPLMVLIMAVFIFLFGKIYAVAAIQIFGVALLVIDLLVIAWIFKSLIGDANSADFWLGIVLFLTAAFYPIIYWSIMGMETGLLTTLVLIAVFLMLNEKRNRRPNWFLAFILAAAYLTRPDTIIFITIICVFRALSEFYAGCGFRKAVGEVFTILGVVVLYQWFRFEYYGQWYPNTYVLKATGMDMIERLRNGLRFTQPFIEEVKLFVGTAIFALLFYLLEVGRWDSNGFFRKRGSYAILFTFAFLVYLGYQVFIGGDAWPFYWRFIVPYFILFFAAFGFLGRWLELRFGQANLIRSAAIVLCLSLIMSWGKTYAYDLVGLRPYQSHPNDYHINTALVIDQLVSKNASIAFYWAGTVPYYTERYAIDPLGKIDPYVARLPADTSGAAGWGGMLSVPGHNKYDLEYSLKTLRPTVIQFAGSICKYGRQDLSEWCSKNYRLVDYHGIQLLLKKDAAEVHWKLIP